MLYRILYMFNQILYALKLKKRPPNIGRENVMQSIPLRNTVIKWEMDDKNEVSLVIPQKDKLWVKITSKIFMIPDKRVVVLDEVGSFVWTLCDGKNSVEHIVKRLCNKYNLTRKEAEVSLLTYMRQLGKRGFVGFAVSKEQYEEMEKRKKKK
ncbi:PqqD family protein [Candidatus Poribacteria bacterium]|nr:PqqD family protein [Candidatus Poribacteria bacterium]